MTLRSIRAEIERLKELMRSRPVACICEYVELAEDKPLTAEQEVVLEANRRCYESNHNKRAHSGFTCVEITPEEWKASEALYEAPEKQRQRQSGNDTRGELVNLEDIAKTHWRSN